MFVKTLDSSNTRPQVLLVGNGINQLSSGASWNDFLKAIARDRDIVDGMIKVEDLKCPEPLKAILVTEDNVGLAMKDYCNKMTFHEISQKEKELYCQLLKIGFDDIITTNYTYELEISSNDNLVNLSNIKALMKHTDEIKRAESKYLLHTYNSVEFEGVSNRVWHIHGEARKPESTVLGHYYYGNLLFKIKELLDKRNYKTKKEVSSWVDSFIFGDIYILGFGYGFSEIDLWWLINRKAREKFATGKVYFYEAKPVGYNEKHKILNMLKNKSNGEKLVEVIDCGYKQKIVDKNNVKKQVLDGEYQDFYSDAICDISKKIKEKRG